MNWYNLSFLSESDSLMKNSEQGILPFHSRNSHCISQPHCFVSGLKTYGPKIILPQIWVHLKCGLSSSCSSLVFPFLFEKRDSILPPLLSRHTSDRHRRLRRCLWLLSFLVRLPLYAIFCLNFWYQPAFFLFTFLHLCKFLFK